MSLEMITGDTRALAAYMRGTKALRAGRHDEALKFAGWAYEFAGAGPMAARAQALLDECVHATLRDLSAAGARTNPVHTAQLADGTTGYFMRSHDDCWAAAIATAIQVPLTEVPFLGLDERLGCGESQDEIAVSAWGTIEDFLAERGWRMLVHAKVPVRRRRWIGVIPRAGATFDSHCLVMAGSEMLFDPGAELLAAVNRHYSLGVENRAEHVRFGYSFARTQTTGGR